MSPAGKAAPANCGSHTAATGGCARPRGALGGRVATGGEGPAQPRRLASCRGLWGTPRAMGSHCRTWSRDWCGPQRLEKMASVRVDWGGKGGYWGTGYRQLWSSGNQEQERVSRQMFLSAYCIPWHTIKAALGCCCRTGTNQNYAR